MSSTIQDLSTRATQLFGNTAAEALETVTTGIKQAAVLGVGSVKDEFTTEIGDVFSQDPATRNAMRTGVGEAASVNSPRDFFHDIKDPNVLEGFSELVSMPDVVKTFSDPRFKPTEALGKFIEPSPDSLDPNAVVQWVLRQSYMDTTEDLRFFADKVKHFNELKEGIRQELGELRQDPSRVVSTIPEDKLQLQEQPPPVPEPPDPGPLLKKLTEMQIPVKQFLDLQQDTTNRRFFHIRG